MYRFSKHVAQALILAGILLTACKDAPTVATRSLSLMGSRAFISVPIAEQQVLSLAAANLRATATRIHDLVDIYNPGSEIARANRIGFAYRFPISSDTYRIIEYARRLSELTGGVYDITDAGLKELWISQYQRQADEPLAPSMIQAALSGIGVEKIELTPTSVRLKNPYTQIDITSIAQTYVLDRAIIEMRRQGWRNILVGLNHSVRCLGSESPGKPWTLEIKHPLGDRPLLGTLSLRDGMAAATIHLPDHAILVGDVWRSTILNARTGEPSKGMVSVTVIGPVATEAYALAHALFAVGLEGAPALLQLATRYHAVMIAQGDPMDVWISHGMAEFFSPTAGIRVTREPAPATLPHVAPGETSTESDPVDF